MARAMGAVLVSLVVSLPGAGSAWAGETEPAGGAESAAEAQLLVQDTTARVLAAMSRDKKRILDQPAVAFAIVEGIVMPNVDLDRVSKLVLGTHWRRATPAQRERFKREFGTQLLRTYVIGVTDYLTLAEKLGTEISYLPSTANDDKSEATVRTEVGRSAMQVRIDYRLHRRDDSWMVYDVLVEGVSAVRTYRKSFVAETSKRGIDSLTDRIAAKNRQFGPA
jgi:phospholipid transport system substrate-binding protein